MSSMYFMAVLLSDQGLSARIVRDVGADQASSTSDVREVRSAVLGGRRRGRLGWRRPAVTTVVAVGPAAPEGGVAAGDADERGHGEDEDPTTHHLGRYSCAARLRRVDRSILPAARIGISASTTTRSGVLNRARPRSRNQSRQVSRSKAPPGTQTTNAHTR